MQQQSVRREYGADVWLLLISTLFAAASRFLPCTAFFRNVIGFEGNGLLLRWIPALLPTLSALTAAAFFVYFLATCKRRAAHDFVVALVLIAASLTAAGCFWHYSLMENAAQFYYDADAFLVVVCSPLAETGVEGLFFDPQFFVILFCYLYLITTMLYQPVKRELEEELPL